MRIKRKKDKILTWFFMLLLTLVCVLSNEKFVNAQEEEKITVWSVGSYTSQYRYFQLVKFTTNAACKGGVWWAEYYHKTNGWTAMTGKIPFGIGQSEVLLNDVMIKEGIPAASPSWKENTKDNFYSYHWSGSSYRFWVSAEANYAELKFRFWSTWNTEGQTGIFDSMQDKGYATRAILDPIDKYYYVIDSSPVAHSLDSVSYSSVKWTYSSGIPFDVTDFGKYLHVRAESMDGAFSTEYVTYLKPTEDDKKYLTIRCGTGISKVTATGAVSGTQISCTNSTGTTESFLPGETVTITETHAGTEQFSKWTSTRTLQYLNGTDAASSTAQFQMPASKLVVTANAVEKKDLTIQCGNGISKVTATGGTSGTQISCTNSTGTTGKFLPGETVTITETQKSNGEFVNWTSNQTLTYQNSTSAASVTAKVKMPSNATTITANGKLYYYVTVKPGTGVASVTLNGESTSSSSGIKKKCYQGNSFTVSAAMKEYYHNPTWTASPSGYTKTGSNGFSETVDNSDIIYTVTAEKQIFTVSYGGLSGANPNTISTVSGEGGSTQTVTSVTPAKSGFTFVGWQCNSGPSDMVGKSYHAGDSFTLKANTVFVAQWKAEQYTVRLHSNKPDGASANVAHAETLLTSSIELKDATAEQIQSWGGANFGFVTSKYHNGYENNYYYKNCYSLIEDNDNAIDWVYHRLGNLASKSMTQFASHTNTDFNADTLNIIYDYTTKKYYVIGINSDFINMASTYIGTSCYILTGSLAEYTGYVPWLYTKNAVCLGSSYKINPDVVRQVELKDMTRDEIGKYTNIPGFATMTACLGDEIYAYGESSHQHYYYFLSGNSDKSGTARFPWKMWDSYSYSSIAGNKSDTLHWVYTGNNIEQLPSFLTGYYNMNSSSYSNSYNVDSTNAFPFPEGTVFYDYSSKGYYVYTGVTNDDLSGVYDTFTQIIPNMLNKHSCQCFLYLGNSYKISIPEEWTWSDTDTSQNEGYFTKDFTKFSNVTLPKLTNTTTGAYELTGWHASQWTEEQNGKGMAYAAGTPVANLVVTNETAKSIDLYAHWEPNTYRIMYYGNGGTLGGSSTPIPVNYKYDTTYQYLQNPFEKEPTNEGTTTYTFTNWYNNPAQYGTAYPQGNEFQNLTATDGGIVYRYAGWSTDAISYSVRFHPNGAVEEKEIPDITGLNYTTKFKLPNAANSYIRKGYQFKGWVKDAISYDEYTKKSNENPLYLAYGTETEVSKLTNIDGAVVHLYALWEPVDEEIDKDEVYKINFNGNGADFGNMETQIIHCGTFDTKLNPNVFGKANHKFLNWNTEADGSGISKSDGDIADFSLTNGQEITLYAQWEQNVYTIKYDKNSENAKGYMEMQEVFGGTSDIPLNLNEFVWEDYEFTGWNTKPDGSGILKEDGAIADFGARGGETVTLYAQWKPAVYYVAYDKNSDAAMGYMETSKFAFGEEETLPKFEFMRTGYHIDEAKTWYLNASGMGTAYANQAAIKDIAPTDADTPPTVTLYADWIANTYTIKYDLDGGTGTFADQTKTYNTDLQLHEGVPVKKDYEFLYWEVSDGSGMYAAGDTISYDLTTENNAEIVLVAQWEDIAPPVIFDENEAEITEDELILPWTNKIVKLSYTAEDLGTEMKSLVLEQIGSNWKKEGVDSVYKAVYEEGITKFKLTATDNSDNQRIIYITVRIDKQVPTNDNQESYAYEAEESMTLTIHAKDTGGSGIKSFQLYEGNAIEDVANLILLQECDNIAGDDGSITYTFTDNPEKSDVTYSLITQDIAGNETRKIFKIETKMGISAKAWKYNGTTVYDDTETLQLVQYGDMRVWIEAKLTGFTQQVIYDFCDELNALGVEDITHDINPVTAETVDQCVVELPDTMEFDKPYPVTIKAVRNDRIISVTLNLGHKKLTKLPRRYLRYVNGMAMPKGGGEWMDYDAEERGQGTWTDEFTVVRKK